MGAGTKLDGCSNDDAGQQNPYDRPSCQVSEAGKPGDLSLDWAIPDD